MSHIERYIILEVLRPFSFVLIILVAMFACFSSARYLAEAVTETLGVYFMLKLIVLKTLIALEVLVPIALYTSVVIGLGRLHQDREIVALSAAGVGNSRIIGPIVVISVPIALAVGALSLYGRPWAYQNSYILDATAKADLNTDRFQAGRFYGNEDTGTVIYIAEKDEASGAMSRIFYYSRKQEVSEITAAVSAGQDRGAQDERLRVSLHDGLQYRLQQGSKEDEVIRFEKLVRYHEDPELSIGYKRKAEATPTLLKSDRPEDIAEVQWRLSRPVATLLLALIAIPLSRSSPRQGKNERVFTAALIFAVYYNLSGVAQTWVEQGVMDEIPGVWWLHTLMALVVFMFLYERFNRRYLQGFR